MSRNILFFVKPIWKYPVFTKVEMSGFHGLDE